MASPGTPPWSLSGDFVTFCNCDYFCPCMLSLGRARPTHGSCHGVVARASSARYRDHGFNWRLEGTSGEITRFSWKGP